MTLFPLLSSSSSSPCVSHNNNCRSSSSSSRCFSSKSSFSTLSRGKGGKIHQNHYSTIATRATRSNDSNNNINNNSKYIEKAKVQDLLSNLERWLRENGSEMNEKCEFGFSSMMEEDNTLMIRKNTCGIFNRGSKSSSTSSSRSNISSDDNTSIKKNESILKVGDSVWMTAEKAREDADGKCGKILKRLAAQGEAAPAWVELSVYLVCELEKGESSFYAPYLSYLREATVLESPLFWSTEDVNAIAGSQLLDDAAGYDSYVRGTYESLNLSNDGVPEDTFLWAFGILRSRAQQPMRDGSEVTLVPGLDMLNHKARYSENDFGVGGKKKKPDWQVYEAGMDDGAMGSPMAAITNLFGGGGKKEDARGSSGSGKSSGAKSENNNIKFASFRAQQDTIQPGEEIFMDYYASINFDERPLDGKTCVDYGFVDPVERNGGYELRIGIPENDPNRDDKIDICDVSQQIIGGGDDPTFYLKAYEDPDPNLRVFSRLLNIQGSDAFLLEALFRNNAWELISEPVSKENETQACETMIAGCKDALLQYETSIEQDEDMLSIQDISDEKLLSIRVLLGEKKALRNTLRYFETIRASVDRLEYYQERRLRQLNLLDEDGSSTYDPFNDFIA
ncbi:unnamed protein product [Bathycoccus prasinos]